MKLGESLALGSTLTDDNMTLMKQLGVDDISVGIPVEGQAKYPLSRLGGKYYEAEDLVVLKKWVNSHGLELSSVSNPGIGEKIVSARAYGQLGAVKAPGLTKAELDEQVENWNKTIRAIGKAGIPVMMWNLHGESWRTTAEPVGRGGTIIRRFDYEIAKKTPVTKYGEISEKQMWDSTTYVLKAVMPVAEESGVKLALHPMDPQPPVIAGIARIIRSPEAYDQLFKLVPSKANTMGFCLGCFQQMMEPDGIFTAIKHFASEGRIAYVHIRGVTGNINKFDEVWPDEGKLDFVKALRTLKEAGFNGVVSIDHTPRPKGDDDFGHITHAYQIGFARGVMKAAGVLD